MRLGSKEIRNEFLLDFNHHTFCNHGSYGQVHVVVYTPSCQLTRQKRVEKFRKKSHKLAFFPTARTKLESHKLA